MNTICSFLNSRCRLALFPRTPIWLMVLRWSSLNALVIEQMIP